MIYFGITVRSKAVARNWDHVTADFNRTLFSIYRQTNPNFKVLVACHEIPELFHSYDNRVEFLQTDIPVPSTPLEMMQDKGYKLSMIGKRIREYGGGYTMIVDADDLVSNKIAEYVDLHPNENGFSAKYGFIFNIGDTYCKKTLYPDQICGSCLIVNYLPNDLPATLPESPHQRSNQNHIIRKPHPTIRPYLKKHGRSLSRIPFATTIYMRNTGDNHSMIGSGQLGFIRRIEQFFRPKVALQKIQDEFGLFF